MPPKPCPRCGRFLENAFVDALAGSDAACPHCDANLTASMFDPAARSDELTEVGDRAEPVLVGKGGSDDEVSVRPPDLEPDMVRDRSLDVLAGWDVGVGEAEIASWRRDRRPVPIDTLVVVGAGFTGLFAGLLLVPRHRAQGASLGALTGLVGAATARRVWRLRT